MLGSPFLWANNYLAQEGPLPSEKLLEALAPEERSSAAFVDSAHDLLREEGLSGRLREEGDQLPVLQSDARFKYRPQYLEASERAVVGEEVVIATLTEDDRVIGFGVAKREADLSKITEGIWDFNLIDTMGRTRLCAVSYLSPKSRTRFCRFCPCH